MPAANIGTTRVKFRMEPLSHAPAAPQSRYIDILECGIRSQTRQNSFIAAGVPR